MQRWSFAARHNFWASRARLRTRLHPLAAAGAGFLLAVLSFDLMLGVQIRKYAGDLLPLQVLTSISAHCRCVTTEAYPMNRAVALMVVLTLAAICAEIAQSKELLVDRLRIARVRRKRVCADHDTDCHCSGLQLTACSQPGEQGDRG
jgi:hypothetical protein